MEWAAKRAPSPTVLCSMMPTRAPNTTKSSNVTLPLSRLRHDDATAADHHVVTDLDQIVDRPSVARLSNARSSGGAAAWVEAKASAYWEACVTSELIAVVALEGEAAGR